MKFRLLHNTGVTKQWTAKWPYIANAVFRIVQYHREKVTFGGFREGITPIAPPWIRPGVEQLHV